MNKRIFFYCALVLLTSACSLYTVDSQDISTDYYPPKNSSSDVVYLDTVTQPHEIIGYVTVDAERQQRSIDDVIDKMKYEAAVLGGDAITDIKTDVPGYWKKLPAQEMLKNGYVRANFSAAVVVFK